MNFPILLGSKKKDGNGGHMDTDENKADSQ